MDSGKGFPLPQLEEMKESLPEVRMAALPLDAPADAAAEKRAGTGGFAQAGHVLNEICHEAREFIKQGRKEYEIVADIDRLARDKGVEDIRILAGERRLAAAKL